MSKNLRPVQTVIFQCCKMIYEAFEVPFLAFRFLSSLGFLVLACH